MVKKQPWWKRIIPRITFGEVNSADNPVNSSQYEVANNYATSYLGSRNRYVPSMNYSRPGQIQGTAPDQQDAARQTVKVDQYGASGILVNAGYINEEYLQNLRGHQRADVFDEMRRSDANLAMCIAAVKNPLLSANWELEPGDDSEEQQTLADFTHHLLFEAMDVSFSQFLVEALTCIDFGYSLFERTDKVVQNHPKWGNYNAIKQMGWRSPRTIHRFNMEPTGGELLSVSQYIYGDMARVIDIPAEFLTIFSIQREGSNYEGISFLRKCYGNWFRKDHYMKMNAIGIERFAVPTPIISIPPGLQGTPQYDFLIDALEVYCTHESNYLIKPQGWDVDIHTNTYDPAKVEASIQAEDARMVKAFNANFLELGQSGKGGSYALSADQSEFFLTGLKYVGALVCDQVNKTMIEPMIKMNFGPQQAYPRLKVSGIDDKIGQELANALKFLADAQYITPDDQLEESIRKRMGLTKMSKIGQRAVKSVGAAGITGQANPSFTQMSERIRMAELKKLKAFAEIAENK